jgi:hypothetical protein
MNDRKTKLMGLMAAAALALGAHQAGAANVYVTNNCDSAGLHWVNANTYWLMNLVSVRSGETLVIDPGTVIRGMPKGTIPADNNSGTLLVSRGGKIYAKGTAAQPIVFTDQYDDNIGSNPGSVGPNGTDYGKLNNQLTGQWGGLILAGRTYIAWDVPANTSPSSNMTTQIEGLTAVPGYDYGYGGGNDFDNSGELDYISLRYGGFYVNSTKEINGLTLCGVGRGTKIAHIDVYNTKDDAIEFFGGTCGVKHFLTWNNTDDAIDSDTGFRGRMQFMLAVQGISTVCGQNQALDSSDKGLEWDGAGDKTGYNEDPQSCGTMWNYTLVGMGKDCGDVGNTAMNLRHNAGGRVHSGIVLDFAGGCTLIDDFPFNANSSFAKMSQAYAQDSYYLSGTNKLGEQLYPGVKYMGYPDAIAGSKKMEIRDTVFWNMGIEHSIGLTSNETAGTYNLYLGTDNSSAFGSNHVFKGTVPTATGYDIIGGLLSVSTDGNVNLGPSSAGYPPIRHYARETTVYNVQPTFRTAAHPYTCVAKIDPRLSDLALSVGSDTNWSGVVGHNAKPPADGFFTQVDFPGAMAKKNWAGPWSTPWRLGGFVTNNVPTGDEGLSSDILEWPAGSVQFTVTSKVGTSQPTMEWYLVADNGAGGYWYYSLSTGWTAGAAPTIAMPLMDLTYTVPLTGLPSGTYTIYIGVDNVLDGAPSLAASELSYDWVANVVRP